MCAGLILVFLAFTAGLGVGRGVTAMSAPLPPPARPVPAPPPPPRRPFVPPAPPARPVLRLISGGLEE